MLFDIKNLFCNILFVILPYLLTEIFFQRKQQQAKLSFSILSILSIVLCMNFPIIHTDNLMYDLRLIPLLFAILYGGWKISLSLLLLIIGYRFYFSGVGAYISLISYLVFVMVLYPFRSYYHRLSLKKKIFTTTTFSLIHSLLIVAGYSVLDMYSPLGILRLAIQFTITGFITILVEKYQENQLIRESIHQSEKLHAIGEIAASVSHEIRNPMTVVRGFIQLMCQDKTQEKYMNYLTLSMSELDRAEKIINDYLTYARPQAGEFESIPLDDELEHVASILMPYATLHDVEIGLKKDTQAHVWGDRLKLRQAILNLIKNGIESMPGGGHLTLVLYRKSDRVRILIQDTGIGMTKDQIQRLGSPFYSLKEKGTGLGTMVSYRVIESMNGKIEIESEVGKGSQFTISFPIYKQ